MSKQDRSASMHSDPSSPYTGAQRDPLAPNEVRLPESTRTPVTSAQAPNPFASLAPSGRDAAAETQLFEVPRELIEMARAHASASDANAPTPVAPRPDAELEAVVRAYTARLSSKPARAPVELMSVSIAPPSGADPEPMPLTARRVSAPPALGSLRASSSIESAADSRAWLVCAALCVIGLASCALLFGS